MSRHTRSKTKEKKLSTYNIFTRDYILNHPGSTIKDSAKAWNKKKSKDTRGKQPKKHTKQELYTIKIKNLHKARLAKEIKRFEEVWKTKWNPEWTKIYLRKMEEGKRWYIGEYLRNDSRFSHLYPDN